MIRRALLREEAAGATPGKAQGSGLQRPQGQGRAALGGGLTRLCPGHLSGAWGSQAMLQAVTTTDSEEAQWRQEREDGRAGQSVREERGPRSELWGKAHQEQGDYLRVRWRDTQRGCRRD